MESQPISPGGKPDVASTRKPAVSNQSAKKPSPTPSAGGVEDTVTLSNQSKQVQSPPSQSTNPVTSDNKKLLSVTDSNDVVMKIVDKKTQEVVKQIPSEEQLNLKEAIRDVVDEIASSDS